MSTVRVALIRPPVGPISRPPGRRTPPKCICGPPLGRGRRRPAVPSRPRTLASLISIGRFSPAITSAWVCSITEMARLDGVPPNMSVSRMTPAPLLTCSQAARMSRRRRSMSSSGPMQMAATARCGPTTCSMAKTNSSARRPCVTITSPIIPDLSLVGPRSRRGGAAKARLIRRLRPGSKMVDGVAHLRGAVGSSGHSDSRGTASPQRLHLRLGQALDLALGDAAHHQGNLAVGQGVGEQHARRRAPRSARAAGRARGRTAARPRSRRGCGRRPPGESRRRGRAGPGRSCRSRTGLRSGLRPSARCAGSATRPACRGLAHARAVGRETTMKRAPMISPRRPSGSRRGSPPGGPR
jgi:hypothetical protein